MLADTYLGHESDRPGGEVERRGRVGGEGAVARAARWRSDPEREKSALISLNGMQSATAAAFRKYVRTFVGGRKRPGFGFVSDRVFEVEIQLLRLNYCSLYTCLFGILDPVRRFDLGWVRASCSERGH